MASARRLSKVLRTKCGFRQWIAAPKPTAVDAMASGSWHRAFATLTQPRNIGSKRVVEKIFHLDADILAAIKKEASRVNFG
jgi:hypothetical protein